MLHILNAINPTGGHWAQIELVLYLLAWVRFILALFVVPRNRKPGEVLGRDPTGHGGGEVRQVLCGDAAGGDVLEAADGPVAEEVGEILGHGGVLDGAAGDVGGEAGEVLADDTGAFEPLHGTAGHVGGDLAQVRGHDASGVETLQGGSGRVAEEAGEVLSHDAAASGEVRAHGHARDRIRRERLERGGVHISPARLPLRSSRV